MKRDVDNESCPVCGNIPYDSERRVLVSGRVRRSYCSQSCLRIGVRTAQSAQRQTRRRRAAILLSTVLAVAAVGYVRHLLLMLRPQRATVAAPAPVAAPEAPPEVTPFGPHWPPTDDEWLKEFTQAAWVYPLPGPTRRRPARSRQLYVSEPAGKARAHCRSASRCGVDLGGELWGEHVYAARDGVIDRLQRSSEDAPGGLSVRIAHWGGAVFTQYFHLAAIPSHLTVGAHVNAGDVIGLVGDSGLADARAHLHVARSVWPSSDLPEVYWDPEPLMMQWPLHVPERGSVAGLLSVDAPAERLAGTPSPRRRPPPPARHRRGDAEPSTP
jgi:murein DD-endopeptidase MepM/ murein hydrolase activator NlpD